MGRNLYVTSSAPSRLGIMIRRERLLSQGDALLLVGGPPPLGGRSLPSPFSSLEASDLPGTLPCCTPSLPKVQRQTSADRGVRWRKCVIKSSTFVNLWGVSAGMELDVDKFVCGS